MDSKYCILLVEDDYALAMGTEYTLKAEGYLIRHAKNLVEARTAVGEAGDGEINLILLDVMLPDGSGFDFLEEMRGKQVEIPVIFLTAVGDEANIVRGLDLGADDYVTKPFAIEELLARIRVALKKKGPAVKDDGGKLVWHDLTVDPAAYSATYDGIAIELSKREFDLLALLLTNRNIVLGRDTLLQKVCGYDYVGETNVIDVYIRYLRAKIDERFGIHMIQTVRGVGYVIKDE